MMAIHWGGGIDLPGRKMLRGWPCCSSGNRAVTIRRDGMLNHNNPEAVTCKRCRVWLAKAGLLKGNSHAARVENS